MYLRPKYIYNSGTYCGRRQMGKHIIIISGIFYELKQNTFTGIQTL